MCIILIFEIFFHKNANDFEGIAVYTLLNPTITGSSMHLAGEKALTLASPRFSGKRAFGALD